MKAKTGHARTSVSAAQGDLFNPSSAVGKHSVVAGATSSGAPITDDIRTTQEAGSVPVAVTPGTVVQTDSVGVSESVIAPQRETMPGGEISHEDPPHNYLPGTDHVDGNGVSDGKVRHDSHNPKDETMTRKDFRTCIEEAKPGDQQRLREALKLMEKFDLSPRQFFGLAKLQIKELIGKYVNDIPDGNKTPALMETPDHFIHVLHHAFKRLRERHPEHELPVGEEQASRRLSPLAEAQRPTRLKVELASWRPRLVGEPHGTGMGKPLMERSAKRYVVCFWQYCAILVACGIELNKEVTFEAATHPAAQQIVLRRLPNHFAKKTVPSFLGCLHRVSEDLLGNGHPNTVSFATARYNNKDTQTLSASIIQECRDLNGSGALDRAMLTIWDLPDLMRQRSEMAGLRPHDQDARKGYAIAVEIAMEVTSMSVASLYDLNFDTDVVVLEKQRYLKFVDKLGVTDMSPLTESLWETIDDLAKFRHSHGLESPWLFSSGYDTKKKSKQCTANLLATAMESALRKRLTITRVQDAVIINAIDTGNVDPVVLSAEHGHKLTKSFRERYKVALRSRLKKSKGGK